MAKVTSFKTLTHVGADEHAESDDHDGFISSSEDEDDDDAFICHTFTFLSRPTVMKRLSFKNAKSYISRACALNRFVNNHPSDKSLESSEIRVNTQACRSREATINVPPSFENSKATAVSVGPNSDSTIRQSLCVSLCSQSKISAVDSFVPFAPDASNFPLGCAATEKTSSP